MKPRTKMLQVSICGKPVAHIEGPIQPIEAWVSDQRPRVIIPELTFEPVRFTDAPVYSIRFEEATQNCIQFDTSLSVVSVLGNLDSLGSKGFRKILMQVGRTALLQQDCVMIHSACITSPTGDAALLCGNSGSGKSTLTYLLYKSGFSVHATDLCVIDHQCIVLGGTGYLSLYPAIIDRWFPEFQKYCRQEPDSKQGFTYKVFRSKKDLIATGELILSMSRPKIGRIFLIELGSGQVNVCRPASKTEQTNGSPVLYDTWMDSPWLIDGWGLTLPSFLTSITSKREQMSNLFSQLPSYYLSGDFEYARHQIIDWLARYE